MTPLDGSYEVVLSHDWLQFFNTKINWKSGSLELSPSMPHTTKEPTSLTTKHTPEISKVALIGATAFMQVCKAQGTLPF